MKKILFLLTLMFINPTFAQELDADAIFDIKQNAFALYNTNNIDEAYNMLIQIPQDKMDEETLLILANAEEDKNNTDKAIEYLNKSIQKNPKFYKPYYNLGCIFMKKRAYSFAVENFEKAAKLNKKNAYIFYNLACAQMNIGEYNQAKKNLIKAIYIKNDEKNFYYNLAYVNKKLGKEKAAQKVIDFYNSTFVK